MRILLLGDYSNYHACLARALSRMGHRVVVASDGGGWMETSKTLSLSRPLPGRLGGAFLFGKMLMDSRLTGFDIVSLINPAFTLLKPSRLKAVFKRLKKKNGAVFLGSVGTDKAVMDFLTSPDCPLRYNEYFSSPGDIYLPNRDVLEKNRQWQRGDIGDFCDYVYDSVDGVTTALYEYHMAMQRRVPADKLRYVGIPVETYNDTLPDGFDGKINLFLGRHSHRMKFKGTDRIELAAGRVAEEFPDKCRLTVVENIPYSHYVERLNEANVVLDQLYSYSPATNALLAMAKGKAVLSGAEPEYYDFIGETELRPVINAVPDDEVLYGTIKDIVQNPDGVLSAASQGPSFVKKHNDSALVAERCLDFWTSKL